MDLILFAVIFLFSVVLHEVAHGAVALRLGDTTALRAGRLTLNPVKHIDPLWTIAFPALLYFASGGRFAIGMAKPVPVDFSRLRHLRTGMVLVALAGPGTNLLIAFLLTLIFKSHEYVFLLQGIYLNLVLAIFNLIPLPPLDGSRIVMGLLPASAAQLYARLERAGMVIVLLLYVSGFLFSIILPILDWICRAWDLPRLR